MHEYIINSKCIRYVILNNNTKLKVMYSNKYIKFNI